MRTQLRKRRGLSSVMAMIYLTLMAALAVGFYSTVNVGTSVADNEQNISRAQIAAESGMAFARSELDALSLNGTTTTTSNLISQLMTALTSNLKINSAWSNYAPVTVTYDGYTAIPIPAQASTWTYNGSGAVPSGSEWMTVDNSGDQAMIMIYQPVNTSWGLQVDVIGQNPNARTTPVVRTLRLQYNGTQASKVQNPTFNYGMYSAGEINFNSKVTVTGANGSVMSAVGYQAPPNNTTPYVPIQVSATGSSVAGNVYWDNTYAERNINWDSMKVDGYLPSQGQFQNHAQGDVATPTAPTFDTSPFASYVSTQNPGSGVTTITNADLGSLGGNNGTYTFTQPVTINGVLYIENGVNLIFNNDVTINGSIVQADGATSGSIIFNGPGSAGSPGLIQNQISSASGLPNGEAAALTEYQGGATTVPAILAPAANITINTNCNLNGAVVADSLSYNGYAGMLSGVTSSLNGAIMIMGQNGMIFNKPMNITASATSGQFTGGNYYILGNITYSVNASQYSEVGE
jgi:Tfp pilus assembly protein PilX